ncbi:hypothetical protein HMPREF1705_04752 [Acetomicrobium hydrogeniformans ATCC BAA-1850]|uniref:Uncharacterized protein n=1 Tax=Acetomicrobium hydrogeniformans ATCC BAA-1850 TaxID=592015 RepID=A0A0T5X866_9BACT|nr:hypothetical protein HMPREF1705_04752 [Acetomicrobium hydrogeniformans ATCC BAA-1850]
MSLKFSIGAMDFSFVICDKIFWPFMPCFFMCLSDTNYLT